MKLVVVGAIVVVVAVELEQSCCFGASITIMCVFHYCNGCVAGRGKERAIQLVRGRRERERGLKKEKNKGTELAEDLDGAVRRVGSH